MAYGASIKPQTPKVKLIISEIEAMNGKLLTAGFPTNDPIPNAITAVQNIEGPIFPNACAILSSRLTVV